MTAATPRQVALAILRSWLGEPSRAQAAETDEFTLADFQREAVDRARSVLMLRRGVIVADAVGLGKTFVALALIDERLRSGESVAVVAPAALRPMWSKHLKRVARRHGIAFDVTNRTGRLRLISHTSMSYAQFTQSTVDYIVVDEAHAFRNPATHRYRNLAHWCSLEFHALSDAVNRGSAESTHLNGAVNRTTAPQLLLLTATPVNNSAHDLHALIRLFAEDHEFRDLGVASLRAAFAAVEAGKTSPALQRVLADVVIRRDYRATGVDGKFRVPELSVRPCRYDLHFDGIDIRDLLTNLEQLELVPFRLAEFGIANVNGGAELVRLHLLKRLESSTAAFAASVSRMRKLHQLFIEELAAHRTLTPSLYRAFVANGDAPHLQAILSAMVLPGSERRARIDDAIEAARADLARLASLHRAVTQLGVDLKLLALKQLLDEFAGRRVLLFTEFRETANYLQRALLHCRRVGLIDGQSAYLGQHRASRERVLRSFTREDARTRRGRLEAVDLLIATDVLAEGMNLQCAELVISYDLPWNPIRLLQRIGRIRRIGSPHPRVTAAHFLPERGLEELLGLVRRIRHKLETIRATVGGAVDPLREQQNADADFVQALATGRVDLEKHHQRWSSSLDALERLRSLLSQAGPIGLSQSAATSQAGLVGCLDYPVAAAMAGTRPGALVVVRAGGYTRVIWLDEEDGPSEELGTIAGVLEAALQANPATPDRDPADDIARAIAYLNGHDRASTLALRLRAPVVRRLAQLLVRAAWSCTDPRTLGRFESVLDTLGQPLSPRVVQQLGELNLRAPLSGLLDRLEGVLGAVGSGPEPSAWEPVGVLRVPARTPGSASPCG